MAAARSPLVVLFGALLLLNLVLAFATAGAASRQQVPYQPFVVEQLRSGNVESISSLEDSIDGKRKRAVRYTPPGQPSRSTSRA